MLGKRKQPARDGVAGGFRTRAEQQAEEQVQLEVGEPVASSSVAFATTDSMSSVGCDPLRRDELLAVGVHPRPGLLDRQLRQGCLAGAAEIELRLDGLEQPMPFGLRHSQQDADHLHRQLRGDVDHEVERLARLDGIQQPPGAAHADRPRRGGSSAASARS